MASCVYVSIENKEYVFEHLTEQQQTLFRHCKCNSVRIRYICSVKRV